MRTSGQLTLQFSCGNNTSPAVSTRHDYQVNAKVQKDVLRMVLEGDLPNNLEDIKAELLSGYEMADYHWENRYQQSETIARNARRIKNYTDYERRHIIFPEQEDMTNPQSNLLLPDTDGNMQNTNIDWFGEQVKALPDYITRNGNITTLVKIHTGRAKKDANEQLEQNEVYALALLGRKLYPNDTIHVEENYLGDHTKATEKEAITYNLPYIPSDSQIESIGHRPGKYPKKGRTFTLDESTEKYFQLRHEMEESGELEVTEHDCSSCPRVNVCNYTEPPVSLDVNEAVRPFSSITPTEEQRRVIEYHNDDDGIGVARVNAGAGAGKTFTVAARIEKKLKQGVDPAKLLLITFTNAGAEEMTARTKAFAAFDGVDVDWSKFTSTTFNAFCQGIIEEHYDELGFTRPPKVVPDEIRADRINHILSKYPRVHSWAYDQASGGNPKYKTFAKNALEAAKDIFAEIKREDYTRLNNPWNGKNTYSDEDLDNIFMMYKEYNDTIHAENKIEFDDQIKLVMALGKGKDADPEHGREAVPPIHPGLFEELGYEHIIVDEFQDTDLPQIELLRCLKDTQCFKTLLCVGDDSQSIFGFRHTSPEYMINFGKYLGDGNEATGYRFDDFSLVENHRSTGNIINMANKINTLNENRVDKDLIPTRPEGDPVVVTGYYTEKQEYETTAKRIKAEIDCGKDPADIAFLASNRYQLQQMADALTKIGVPSVLMNPIPYTQNSKCAAIATFFDSYTYKTTQGYMDYLNCLENGAYKNLDMTTQSAEIQAFAQSLDGEACTYDNFMTHVKALDPDQKDECFQDFIEKKLETCTNMDELKDLFRCIKLYGQSSTFKREGRYAGVALSTIHSAKGLEWDSVYYSVDKLDREMFHKWRSTSPRTTQAREELNREWFVAASRARNHCECVGTYTIKATRTDVQLNDCLKQAYKWKGQEFAFSSQMLWATKAQEKAEAKAEAREHPALHLYSPQTTRRTVPTAANHVLGEAPASMGNVTVREMTPEECAEYDRLTANAQQMDITDFIPDPSQNIQEHAEARE